MKYGSDKWRCTTNLLKANNEYRYTYRALSILLGLLVLCFLKFNKDSDDSDGIGDPSESSIAVAGTIKDNEEGHLVYGKSIHFLKVGFPIDY